METSENIIQRGKNQGLKIIMKELLVVQLRKKKFKSSLNSAQNENVQHLGYILKLKLIGLLMGWI